MRRFYFRCVCVFFLINKFSHSEKLAFQLSTEPQIWNLERLSSKLCLTFFVLNNVIGGSGVDVWRSLARVCRVCASLRLCVCPCVSVSVPIPCLIVSVCACLCLSAFTKNLEVLRSKLYVLSFEFFVIFSEKKKEQHS